MILKILGVSCSLDVLYNVWERKKLQPLVYNSYMLQILSPNSAVCSRQPVSDWMFIPASKSNPIKLFHWSAPETTASYLFHVCLSDSPFCCLFVSPFLCVCLSFLLHFLLRRKEFCELCLAKDRETDKVFVCKKFLKKDGRKVRKAAKNEIMILKL